VVLIGCCAILAYVQKRTPLGKHIYAIGGNPEAARRAGVHVKTVTVFTFALGALWLPPAALYRPHNCSEYHSNQRISRCYSERLLPWSLAGLAWQADAAMSGQQ